MKISSFAFKIAKSTLGELIVGIGFEKFTNLLPVKRIIENEFIISFYHPKPFWEEHILIVPKKSIKGIEEVNSVNAVYLGEMYKTAAQIAKELKWENQSYSTLINGGQRQEVPQIHMHLFKGSEV